MSKNLQSLLAVAAEMRAVGYPWDSIAERVHRRTSTCQQWPARYPDRWEPLYRTAQLRRFDDLHNEVTHHLQCLLRDPDTKIKAEAIKVFLRCAPAAVARHRELVAPPAGPSAEEHVTFSMDEYHAWDRAQLNRFRSDAGLPPATDEEFRIWHRQQSQGWHEVKCDELGNILPPANASPPAAPAPSTETDWAAGAVGVATLVVGLVLLIVGQVSNLSGQVGNLSYRPRSSTFDTVQELAQGGPGPIAHARRPLDVGVPGGPGFEQADLNPRLRFGLRNAVRERRAAHGREVHRIAVAVEHTPGPRPPGLDETTRTRPPCLVRPPADHTTVGESTSLDRPEGAMPSIDELCINTIRTLSMDAVQQANSGHPGTPMALAPLAYTLYQEVLHFDPAAPQWPNRDRFVLSVGHASMLLYSVLHLAGVKQLDPNGQPTGELAVTLDQIKKFRQLHSRTPGHPESFMTSGVETTTGPLGQGLGNSVGIAIAQRWLAHRYNQPNFKLFDFHVYAMCGDGDLMEGISGEAASLAGHLKLSNLTWMYDNNRITIDGKTDLAFSEDVSSRFQGYRWNVLHVADANDRGAIAAALQVAKGTTDRPTMIIVDSHIGYGAPKKQDTSDAHGEPLGEDEIKGAKRFYGWPENEKWLVPDGVREHFAAGVGMRGARAREAWLALFERYKAAHADLANEIELMQRRELPAGWDKDLPTFPADAKGMATRESGGKVINALAKNVPWLIGGAADLAKSTKTTLKVDGAGDMGPSTVGRNLHFGIREHVMGAVLNGLAQTKVRPFGSGFLIFSDYGRPAIRLSALMGMPTIHVFTHDSIGVGEDGPTHQPIEQIMSLRAIPNMNVLRPADANEVTECWRVIAQLQHAPACLCLTRQALPTLDRAKYAPASGVAKGGYVLADSTGVPDVILIGTGSEVSLCVAAYEKLTAEGVKARVVSLPSWELFEAQPAAYRDSVLPPAVTRRVTVEMGTVLGWERYAGPTGTMLGMRSFGASAPLKDLLKEFHFTAEAVYDAAKKQLGR